jgi:hypothetical protein
MKRCFFITPIGSSNSEERLIADQLRDILKKILKEHDYDLVRADDFGRPGSLGHQIIKLVIESDLAIADITQDNKNVFYELGIRHSTGKPTILIANSNVFGSNADDKTVKKNRVPFDIAQQKIISYDFQDDKIKAISNFEEEIKKHLKYIYSYIDDINNPVSSFDNFKPIEISPNSIDNTLFTIINYLTRGYFTLYINRKMTKLSSESFFVLKDVSNLIMNDIKDKVENLVFEGLVETSGLLNNRIHSKVISLLMQEFKAVSVNDLLFWNTDEGKSYHERIISRTKSDSTFRCERIFILTDLNILLDNKNDFINTVIRKQVIEDKMRIRVIEQYVVSRLAQISEMDFALLDSTAVSFFRFDEGRTYKIDFRRNQIEKYSVLYKEISNRAFQFLDENGQLKTVIENDNDVNQFQQSLQSYLRNKGSM